MAGLLGQGFDDPRSAAIMALSGGLLQGNFGAGLMGANQAFAQHGEQKLRRGLLEAQVAETMAQADERKLNAAKAQAEQQRQAQIRGAMPGLFRQPGMTGGQAVPQEMGGVPMFGQPIGAAPMQAAPGGFDVQRALALGMSPDEIAKYAGLADLGRRKATRQLEVDDGRGGKRIALVDDFGQEVAGMAGYIPPVQVNQGNQVSFVRPSAGVSLPVGMSPSERDASARGWAGVNIQRDQATAGKVPAGYRMKPDGSMEAIPGGPADLKAGAEGQKRNTDAKDVLGLLDEVDKLLPKATGSYAGTGVDEAFRFFGSATEGAKTTAQLKTLQGALIGKMPKMSGPQSDKDVQLYREMAGQVGDPTLPVETRQAAATTIRALNQKYAGISGDTPPAKPTATAFSDPGKESRYQEWKRSQGK